MAMKNIRDNFAIQAQMQETLGRAGIDQAALDKLMSTTSIERILSDVPGVTNYFKLAALGLNNVVDPQQYYEVRGSIPTPDQYREYYDNQNPQPTPYFNMIPVKDLFNPEALGQSAGFTQDQVYAYGKLLAGPGNGGQGTTWNDVQGGGTPGGAGKAMATKSLAPPGGAPGFGGGGNPVPPGGFAPGGPSTGYPGGFDPTAGTQEARGYVDANFQGDPSYGWFLQLFNRQDFVTGIYASGTQMLDDIRRQRQAILTEMAGADPKTVTMLNYKMQDLSSTEREITDKMMRAQHYQNEFVNMVKGMIDKQLQTTDSIIRNMRN
ncbi:MAG TPA: hypothetical protein VJR29_09620 [bacterium]|nr:hypothetical protein [bacterium]